MTKVILNDLANLQNETTATNTLNSNNAVIETAFDNTLSRDGTFPNQMETVLDMNSNAIINLPTPVSNYEPIRLIDVNTINGSGITVSPLPTGGTTGQVLTKNSATNFDTSWVTPTVTTLTPEQFGDVSVDAGAAINAAIASVAPGVPTRVVLSERQYNVVTPIVVSKDFVWIQGSGLGTRLVYNPTINNTALITWRNPAVTTGVYSGRLTDMLIISSDTSHVKTAINLIDVGEMEVSQIYIAQWHDVTSNSVGLKTNGRECSSFHDLKLFADKPIVILPNPNIHIDADHFHFWNLYLLASPIKPCITATGMLFTNTTFDGYQAWVSGSDGFAYDGTGAGGRGFGLSFYNVRPEAGGTPGAYNFFINTPNNTAGILLKNCEFDVERLGIYGRGILNLSLEQIYYPAVISPQNAIDVDTTCASVLVQNCRWESACTQSIGGLTTKYAYTIGGSPIPTNALYSV